jgi:hypothetical protein
MHFQKMKVHQGQMQARARCAAQASTGTRARRDLPAVLTFVTRTGQELKAYARCVHEESTKARLVLTPVRAAWQTLLLLMVAH